MERSMKYSYSPFGQETLELINRVIKHLLTRMHSSTSRYPVSLAELYRYIFDSVDPIDSGTLLAHWISAMENVKYSLFEQKDPLSLITADREDALFFILCGDHGQPVPFRELYRSLQNVNISPATRQTLAMAILLRRRQLWILNQLSNLKGGSAPKKAPSPLQEEGCVTKDSHALGTSYLSQCATNQKTSVSSSMSLPEACQWTASRIFMMQQTDVLDKGYPHAPMVKHCFPVFGQQLITQRLCTPDFLFGQEQSLQRSSNRHQRPCKGLEVSDHQDLKQPDRRERPIHFGSIGTTLDSTAKSPYIKCNQPGCTKRFGSPYDFKRHMRSHTGEKPFVCRAHKCHRAFSRSDNCQTHYNRVHGKPENLGRRFSDVDQPIPSENPKLLHDESLLRATGHSHHQRSSFYVNSGFNPPYAMSLSDSPTSSVVSHSTPVDVLSGATTDDRSYKPNNTTFRYSPPANGSLDHHSSEVMHHTQDQAIALPPTSHQKQPHVCTTCYEAFSRPSDLRNHSCSHTGERPFRCSFSRCGKSFSRYYNAKRHERQVHGKLPRRYQPQERVIS